MRKGIDGQRELTGANILKQNGQAVIRLFKELHVTQCRIAELF
jgi:hypothetical protein